MRTVSSTASALVLAPLDTATAGANPAQGPPRRPRVGLALRGGSAKGYGHLGVLRWFEEHHIPAEGPEERVGGQASVGNGGQIRVYFLAGKVVG